jgi:2-(1,2-epoxy-1,2-dihydrophenyl)acetyl-CoA isomerase
MSANETEDDGGSLLLEVEDGVAWLTLNRPASLNSMTVELMDSLVERLRELAADTAVRCVGLRGAGRAFSAGGDVADIARRRSEAESAPSLGSLLDDQYRLMLHHVESVRLLREMPKPSISAVQGHAVGGGLSLALACDIRIVAADAKLRVGFAARSLSGDFGISYLLAHTVGSARARELMLLDRPIEGDAAATLGLATQSCPPEKLGETAGAVARELAAGPTIAMGRMKENLRAAETLTLEELLRVESMNQRVSANTSDAAESGRAFAERRPPHFTGR